VRALQAGPEGLRIERQTESGYDVLTCPLPALVTVTAGATEPRYPSLKGIMGAKQKPFEELSLADLGIDGEQVAVAQSVAGVVDAPAKTGGRTIGADEDGVVLIADLLAEAKVI
jgi:electron transfer flavoprotein beta subunit